MGSFTRWLRVATIAMVLAALAGRARADNVDELIGQLRNSDSEKVRLAAALNLAKLGDAKAILAMASALGQDSSKSVRSAAAVGLGQLVTDRVKGSARNLAMSALRRASESDESDFVKAQADKALKAIGGGATGPTPPTTSGGGAIYVNIGPMSSKTGTDDDKFRAVMVKVATKTMGKVASEMSTDWPGGPPTKQALAAKSAQGFYVDGTLNELKVKESGSTSTVSCKISMLLASFPDKSVFGFLNGGASVQASTSPRDEALAREDCVQAVVEDLIAKKIVPTIKSKAGAP